ncbi:MAG: hypothetical protein LBE12_12455 [Planctomycetaceae bacterium]|nr:hypothetical protein [Planctomycetaceae bacterium]
MRQSPLSTLNSQLSTINYYPGLGKVENSCSGGCASLHRRIINKRIATE